LVSLDYDLAGAVKGKDVASYIAQSLNLKAKIIIHSMSAHEAEEIRGFLPQAIHVPFSKMIKSNAVIKRLRQELSKGVDINWLHVFGKNDENVSIVKPLNHL